MKPPARGDVFGVMEDQGHARIIAGRGGFGHGSQAVPGRICNRSN
jgi:hypothetical protein